MLPSEQLELHFGAARRCGRDRALEDLSAMLLRRAGAARIAESVRVQWSRRLRSAAGRADFRTFTVTLNPLLHEHGEGEIDRTLRHELAHLVAHCRAGRRRIQPHGAEWRQACAELGIAGEPRCHALPFPVTRRSARYLYRCPRCRRDFPRVRRIRRRLACLACCRRENGGEFDKRAQLRLVSEANPA